MLALLVEGDSTKILKSSKISFEQLQVGVVLMERSNCLGAVILVGRCLGVVFREQSSQVGIVAGEIVQGVTIWGLIVQGTIITVIQGLIVLEPQFILKYNSSDNFLSPVPVFEWLIFCCGNLKFHSKSHENNKNPFFLKEKK